MIACSRLEPGDIPSVLGVSLEELGSDYLSASDFEDAIESGGQFCLVARLDGVPVGFAICKLFGPEDVDDALRLPDCPERDSLLSKSKIGLLDSVAVSDRVKGKGAGTALSAACMERFIEEEVESVTAMAWEDYTGHSNIAPILLRMGLSPSIAIKGYWNQFVSSPEGHDCPMCGAPCRCFGRLYLADL